jgi:SAM-dependent methyltransferase
MTELDGIAMREGAPPDFLEASLREWPAAHALLRAIELRKLWRYPLAAPVLDIGCGDGTFTRLLFAEPLEVGLDVQAGEVDRARRAGSHRQVLVGSATCLPFGDGAFRNVFSNCVLEHIDGLDLALREIHRVLQPGGVLLTTVPTPRWESEGPFPLLRRWGWHRLSEKLNDVLRRLWHHVTVEDESAWRTRLAGAGLTLLKWEPYMAPPAYAAYAQCLPWSFGSFVVRRLTGRWFVSKMVRSLFVPLLARWLRRAYTAEDAMGACALVLAIKRQDMVRGAP